MRATYQLLGFPNDGIQTLKCPKTDVQVVQGLKSRDKTIAIAGMDSKGDEESLISDIKEKLVSSVQ